MEGTPLDSLQTPLTKVAQLKTIAPNQPTGFMSLLLVKKVAERTAKNGATFLTVDFADKTGSFGVVIFSDSPYCTFFKTEAPEGSVVLLTGTTAYYQERFSPKVMDLRLVTKDEYAKYPVADLIDASTENPVEMWDELQTFIGKIQNEKLRDTVLKALEEVGELFRSHPAGRSMHHAYRHGLLEHTLHVARDCEALLPNYKEIHADLARAGAVLHDIGKVYELSYDLTTKYSRLGILQGHVVLGYRIVRGAGLKAGLETELLERLEHIMLAHQGELEYGAPVRPATPEALFIFHIDNLDAKMGAVQNALRNAGADDEFSENIPALGVKMLVKGVAQASGA